jgi:uroporphyrinogen-III synthase
LIVRVVITRAENEAMKMATSVEGIGCTPLVASMMDIEFEDEPIDVSDFQGVMVTSPNGVRALEKGTEDRDISIYCVGPQTRKLAEEAGFKNVSNSFGGIKNLPVFLKRQTSPEDGPILFVHGGNVTGTPVQDLKKAGFQAVAKRVYYAAPVKTLPDEVLAEFKKETPPEVVTFMSIRTFKLFREVMEKEGLIPKLRGCEAVCISPAVADFAREIRWKKVHTASDMTGTAVMAKVAEINKEHAGATS